MSKKIEVYRGRRELDNDDAGNEFAEQFWKNRTEKRRNETNIHVEDDFIEIKEEVQTPTKALSMYGKLESSLESSPIIISSSNTTPSKSPRFSTELPIRFSPRLQEKRNSMFLLADGTQPHELPYGNSTNFASVDVESPLPKMQRSMKRKAMMDSDDSVNKSSPFTVEISDNEFDRSPRNPQQAKRKLFISDTYMPNDCSIQGDSSALGLSEEFVEHYDSDPLLPIYKPLSTGIKTKEAIQLLLRPLKPTQLARNIPLDIQRNVSFVFSIQNIGHWKNALCDGMGRWTQTGTETVLYNLDVDGEIRVISEIQSTEDSVRVYRRKYVNASYNKLHRIVIHLENPNTSEILDQMFVQYYFEGIETAVNVAPHGNSKKAKKYQRTNETTKQRIQDLCKTKRQPKDIFHTIIEDQGGLQGIKSGAHMARDRMQIRNFRRRDETESTDPVIECSDLAKAQELKENRFLRDVRSAPEFTMFMANERQLEDINKFCTDEESVSVLGVDTTFNIGQYYVTITTYRHLMLTNAFGVEPVMLGPILLHQRKSFESYFKLSSSMLQNCPNLQNLRVFGTDGDVNLGNAFQVCFGKSAHLLCDLHMVDNIEKKLGQLNIKGRHAKEYLVDIFGRVDGSIKVRGLVDSLSENELEDNMESLKEEWKSRHQSGEEFLTYFLENKYELVKQCMTADIRSRCGLGFPPKTYTQDGNECINAVLKADILSENKGVKKKLNPYDFVKIAEQSVRRQENEIKLALIGKGEYQLKPAYQHLMVEENLYWRKSESQKEAVFKRLQSERVGKDKMRASDPMPNIMLSVKDEVDNINSVPTRTLREMFDSAASLTNEDGNVVPLPGSKDGKIYIVANNIKPTDPFMVKFAPSTVTAACENKCARWMGFKICEHTIAVVSVLGNLKNYLKSFKKQEEKRGNTSNITKLVNVNMPANRLSFQIDFHCKSRKSSL